MTNEFNTVCPTCGKRFYSVPNPKILRTVKKCEACKKESLKKSHYKYLKKYFKANKEKLGYADPYYFKHREEILQNKKKERLEKLGLERFFKCVICGTEIDRLSPGFYITSKTCKNPSCKRKQNNENAMKRYLRIKNTEEYKAAHRQWYWRKKEKGGHK